MAHRCGDHNLVDLFKKEGGKVIRGTALATDAQENPCWTVSISEADVIVMATGAWMSEMFLARTIKPISA